MVCTPCLLLHIRLLEKSKTSKANKKQGQSKKRGYDQTEFNSREVGLMFCNHFLTLILASFFSGWFQEITFPCLCLEEQRRSKPVWRVEFRGNTSFFAPFVRSYQGVV